jgi:hypothetical protein
MKKLLLSVLIGSSLLLSAKADVVSGAYDATNHVIYGGPMDLQSITVLATNNVIIRLYDLRSAASPVVVTNAPYVNSVYYMTNATNAYIDTGGFTNFMTNYVLWTATVTNVAATNAATPVAIYACPSNMVSTFNNINVKTANGLVMSNDTGVTVIFTYNRRG